MTPPNATQSQDHEIEEMMDSVQAVLSTSNLEKLLKQIVEEAPALVDGAGCSVYLIPELVPAYDGTLVRAGEEIAARTLDREFIVLAATSRPERKQDVGRAFYLKGEGLTGWIFQHGRPLQIEDQRDEDELRAHDPLLRWADPYEGSKLYYEEDQPQPFLAVPLLGARKVFGVIKVPATVTKKPFPPYARGLFMSFAGVLSTLIRKTKLVEDLTNSISELLHISPTFEQQWFDRIVDVAAKLIDGRDLGLYLLDAFGEKIELQAAQGEFLKAKLREGKCSPYSRGEGLTGWVFRTGKPLCVRDVERFKEPHLLSDEELSLISDGPRINEADRWIQWRDKDGEFVASDDPAFLAVPIKAEDDSVLGVLRAPAVGADPTWGGERSFDSEDLRVFQSFADSVALFLQNMRRKDLSDMLIELGAIPDEESLFRFVVERTPKLVRARGCSILLMRPHRKEKPLVLSYTNSHWLKQASGEVIALEYDLGEGKSGFVASTGMALVINYYGSGDLQRETMDADCERYRRSPRNLVDYLLDAEGRPVGLIRLVGDGVQTVQAEFQEFVRQQQIAGENSHRGLPSPHGNRCETGAQQDAISFMAVPIKDERGQVQGIIRLPRTDTGGYFSDEDLNLLESIANRLTLTLRSLALLHSNLQRSEKLERLALSFKSLIGQFWDEPLQHRLERIVKAAGDILGAEICSLWLVKRPGYIRLVAAHGNVPGSDRTESGDPIELPIRSGIGVGLTGHIAAGSQSVRLHGGELRSHHAVKKADDQPHIPSGKCYSLLGIPLTRETVREDGPPTVETIGLLKAENKRDEEGNPNPLVEFTQEDEAISIVIAKTVVTILDNAQYVQELEALQRVGTEVTGLLTLDNVLPMLLERLRGILNAEYVRIQLDDPRRGQVQVDAGHRPPHAQLGAFPIKVQDEEIGKLELERVNQQKSQTLARFITQAAVAIRNAQLFEQAEVERRKLESLAKVSAHLLEFTDRERLFRNLVTSAADLLSAEECCLFLVDPLGSRVELVASSLREVEIPDPLPARVGTKEGVGLAGYVAAAGEVLNFANSEHLKHPACSSQDTQHVEQLPSGESHSVLLVPIRRPDEPPIGVLKVENKAGPNLAQGFLGDEELLTTLANQAVIAIRNADLYASAEGALQRQVDKLVALREIDRSITLLDHLDAILDVIVDKAVSLSRSRADAALIALRLPEEAGLIVRVCYGNEAVWKEDLLEEEVISQALGGQQSRQKYGPRGHWKLAVPLWRKEEVCGVVAMACVGREEGLEEDLRWLESLAGQASIAVEREERRQALDRVEEEKDAAAQMLLISGFSSIVAHNTANVIGTIPLDIKHLHEQVDPKNKEAHELLDDIRKAAEKMLDMALEMHRPDHHERQAVNLGDLLSEARDHTNPPDWIDVRIVGAESVPRVYVPRLSVREVFANIIKNAVEAIAATGADEGKITVECSAVPDTGEVLVSISDTGCGFTEQQRAQLFQPLWKQKPRRGRGMGFALWWAHKLLTVIGGRISAESPGMNEGATFHVWLPAEGREVEQGEQQ